MIKFHPGGLSGACREASARLLVGMSRAPPTALRIACSVMSAPNALLRHEAITLVDIAIAGSDGRLCLSDETRYRLGMNGP